MKANFVITTKTGKSFENSLPEHNTEILVLTKLAGVPLGAGPRAIDQLHNGLLTERMDAAGFTGQLGQTVLITLTDGHHQKHILMLGLGTAARFNQCTLAEAIGAAVTEAVKINAQKLSIAVVGHRLLALHINLRGTAHIVRQAAERTLATFPSNSRFQIEFVCGAQAKRHLEQGLAIPLRRKQEPCCLANAEKA